MRCSIVLLIALTGCASTLRVGEVSIPLVRVPAGSFEMGSPESEPDRRPSESPRHRVTIERPFLIGRHEITRAQWNAVMGLGAPEGDGGLAQTEVSFDDAMQFTRELSRLTGRTVRLPTEEEWEYVCRAGTATAFSFGDQPDLRRAVFNTQKTRAQSAAAYHVADEEPRAQPRVGAFPPNAFGVYDMHGGVWEWTLDPWRATYESAPDESKRAVRGGAWDTAAHRQRCAYRDGHATNERYGNTGLRVVVEAPAESPALR